MSHDLVGIYRLVTAVPTGAMLFALYFLCLGMIFILRDVQEKLPYNISYSSVIGIAALIQCVPFAGDVLREQHTAPVMLNGWVPQLIVVVGSVVVGMLFQAATSKNQPLRLAKGVQTKADSYHNLLVVPLLVFLGATMLPTIYGNGTSGQIKWTSGLLIVWGITLLIDWLEHRFQQREYMLDNFDAFRASL